MPSRIIINTLKEHPEIFNTGSSVSGFSKVKEKIWLTYICCASFSAV